MSKTIRLQSKVNSVIVRLQVATTWFELPFCLLIYVPGVYISWNVMFTDKVLILYWFSMDITGSSAISASGLEVKARDILSYTERLWPKSGPYPRNCKSSMNRSLKPSPGWRGQPLLLWKPSVLKMRRLTLTLRFESCSVSALVDGRTNRGK